jgi:hypothetical protein
MHLHERLVQAPAGKSDLMGKTGEAPELGTGIFREWMEVEIIDGFVQAE